MKLVVGFLLVSSCAFAQVSGYKEVPKDELSTYVQAITFAMTKNLVEGCNQLGNVTQMLPYAGHVYLKDDEGQPIILVDFFRAYNGGAITEEATSTSGLRLVITSSPDYKSIVNVGLQLQQKEWVNQGTPSKPEWSLEFRTVKEVASCRK